MPIDIKLDDYVAGGYFVTRYVDRKSWYSADLIPERVLSVADEVAPLAPVNSILNVADEVYQLYGISEDKIDQWWQKAWGKEVEWQRTFLTLEAAQSFVQAIVTRKEDVVILGVAVHRKYIPLFEIDTEQEVCGIEKVFKRNQLPRAGEILGFDILSYDFCQFRSWLTPGYPEVIYQEIGIRTNQYGYLSSLEDADRCDEYMEKDNDMALHGWWLPWLVIKYPLE